MNTTDQMAKELAELEATLRAIDARSLIEERIAIYGTVARACLKIATEQAKEIERLKVDEKVLDWLEDESKCYWYEVQSQPDGEMISAGSGPTLREDISAAIAARSEP